MPIFGNLWVLKLLEAQIYKSKDKNLNMKATIRITQIDRFFFQNKNICLEHVSNCALLLHQHRDYGLICFLEI